MAAKQLYQLVSTGRLSAGDYVAVNGPWDKWGFVLKSTPQDKGGFLNLIRGCERRPDSRVVAQF